MIYSRWRPDTGGYDYFESAERLGIGDDVPTAHLPSAGPIGVPSTEAGRKPRGSLRRIGAGPVARGSILPMSRAGLSGLGAELIRPSYLAAVAAFVAAFFVWRRRPWRKG